MNTRKIEVMETRLHRVKTQVGARRQALKDKGQDAKGIDKDPTMRHLLAEVRQVGRIIEALKWEPPKTEKAEKPAKADKPAKAAGKDKAAKPPREKKAKKEEPATED
jgi:hypothetical protein